MKNSIITVLLLIMNVVFVEQIQAQDAKINLQVQVKSLGEVLERIEHQSGYSFVYDESLIDINRKVSLTVENERLADVLKRLFRDTDILYSFSDNNILLSRKSTSKDLSKPGKKKIKITGNVTDQKGEAVIGANISVKGENTGTITDLDGNFGLEVEEGKNITVSYIGYVSQELVANGNGPVKIKLAEDARLIDEVVVTALGIKREKKILGYAIQELKSDEINKTGNPSVTDALQGKVAGLQMNTSNTGLNGSTKITIRGNSSLTDNNQPLWIVDGVPFSDNNSSSASLYTGVDRGGTSIDINPEDVESISVLKGPNAAALYGSRAGNGVILVTTKKGSAKNGFGVDYNTNLTWTNVADALHMQHLYGQGDNGVFKGDSEFSFGAPLDKADYTAWNGEVMPYQNYGEKLKDYFRTGFTQSHNVSVGGVKDNANVRASFGYTKSDGVFERESLEKMNLGLKAGMTLNKYLSIDGKVSLSKTRADNRPVYGKDGEVYQLLFIPSNIRLTDLQQYSTPDNLHVNWVGPHENVLNPYYVNNQYDNMDERWRSFGYFSMKLNLTSWLYATGKYSFDYYRTKIEDGNRTKGNKYPVIDDSFTKQENNFFESNAEFMVIGENEIAEKFRVGYSLGGNIMHQKSEGLSGYAQNMALKGHWYLDSAPGFNYSKQEFQEKKICSAFATFQFSYDDYLNLDLTARNDWSSTLSDSYFYPSANISFIFSDFMAKMNWHRPSWLTFAKVRLSAAQVGKDTDPYVLRNYVTFDRDPNGPIPIYPTIKANENLKPEMSTSYEAGLDLKFLNNRLGLDFTYYHSMTRNQIMRIPRTGSYAYEWINAGKILNEGFELMLYADVVRTRDFSFSLNLNLAHNRSTVVELHPSARKMSFNYNKEAFMIDVGAVEGGKLGDIYANKAFLRDDQGRMILRDGEPLDKSGTNTEPIGNIQPDLLMSVSPTFSYKGFSLSALVDMKFGGDIVSVSEAIATGYGTAKRTEKREDLILPGVDEEGRVNTVAIPAENYYRSIGGELGYAEEFLYDASYIKLKELSLGYNFPGKLLSKTPFSSLRLSLVGRNLCYLLKHTPGTSPEGGFDTTMFSQAIDFTSVPYTRTIGFSVNVSF